MGKIEKIIDGILDAHSVILSKYVNKETGIIEDFGEFAKAIDVLKLEKENEILEEVKKCKPEPAYHGEEAFWIDFLKKLDEL